MPDSFRLWSIAWTPDGTNLICSIRKIIEQKFLFYVAEISPETGKEKVILSPQDKNIFGSVWLPDKSAMLLVVREPNADIRQIWQYFPASQEWRRVTNDNNSYKNITLTRDGKTIVSNQESRLSAVWLTDENGSEMISADKKSSAINRNSFRQITDGISNFDRLGWLADGRLIYSATENGKELIFTINADGTNACQITNGEDGIWISPNVTGNGQNISFLSSRSGIRQVWRIDADGKNPTKMTDTSSPISSAQILRDNSTVIYVANSKTGNTVLFKQTPDGQTLQITESDTDYWAISPDEKLLAVDVLDKTTGKYQIELCSLEDGKIIKTFNFSGNRQMIFTPDGKNLAYDVANGDTGQIRLQPLDGEPRALTDFQTDKIFSFSWSPDGTRLAILRGKQLNDAVLIKTDDR